MKLPQRIELVALSLVLIATALAIGSSINDAPIVDEVPQVSGEPVTHM